MTRRSGSKRAGYGGGSLGDGFCGDVSGNDFDVMEWETKMIKKYRDAK